MMSTPESDRRQVARGRRIALALLGGSLLPVVLAYWAFYTHDPKGATSNLGTLLDPPLQLESLDPAPIGNPGYPFSLDGRPGRWLLLAVLPPRCDSACEQRLHWARQTHVALGKQADRVARVLMVDPGHVNQAELSRLLEADPHLYPLQAGSSARLQRLVEAVGSGAQKYVYLVDPNGNLLMYYDPDSPDKALLLDLKHLLKISQIG